MAEEALTSWIKNCLRTSTHFFLYIGAARDYLAAFVAHRLGMDASPKKTDTMDALKKKLRPEHAGREPVLDHMFGKSWLVPQSDKPDRWETSGWLKVSGALRLYALLLDAAA
jgi:hypothetical protein